MIVVIAPYPAPEAARDGWRSRIAAVDRLFADQPREYVEVVDGGLPALPAPQAVAERVQLHRLDLSRTSHGRRLRELLERADLVYVHTVHYARYVLPFYATGKVVTDIHGLAPEEELMYGKSASRRFYDDVEAVVLRESACSVAVTEAMVEHLRGKHPDSRTEFVVLPVLSLARPQPDVELGPRSPPGRPRVIYSGALQRWQNPDLMFDLVRDTAERYEFTVLTPDVQAAHDLAGARGVAGRVALQTAPPRELGRFYGRADYGLVLRDDHVVNRVACPTKLVEYLWHGVIPVVKSAQLGDFPRWGYCYVTLDDFRAGRLPDAEAQRAMRRQNLEAALKLAAQFDQGAQAVRQLPGRVPRRAVAAVTLLTDVERNVFFPAFSRLTCVPSSGGTAPPAISMDFAEPYGSVEFDLETTVEIARLTFTPIDRECRLLLKAVRITDHAGTEVPFRMSGNQSPSDGPALLFPARPPLLHFDLSRPARVRRFAAEFDLEQIGAEALGKADGAPGAAPASLSHAIRARLKRYPVVVRAYRSLIAPLRRRRSP